MMSRAYALLSAENCSEESEFCECVLRISFSGKQTKRHVEVEALTNTPVVSEQSAFAFACL